MTLEWLRIRWYLRRSERTTPENSLMPRLKPSPGKRKFVTPIVDELQRMLFFELANAKQWNPNSIRQRTAGPNRWAFEGYITKPERKLQWTIEFEGKAVIVTCDEPKIWIRQGLEIDMGNGRIIIGAQE